MIVVTYLIVRALVTAFLWFVLILAGLFVVCVLATGAVLIAAGRWAVTRFR
jgi:hypothetical protein